MEKESHDILVFTIFRVDDKNLSESNTSNKNKVVVPIVASVSSVLVLLVIAILYWKLRRNEQPGNFCFSNQ